MNPRKNCRDCSLPISVSWSRCWACFDRYMGKATLSRPCSGCRPDGPLDSLPLAVHDNMYCNACAAELGYSLVTDEQIEEARQELAQLLEDA